MCFTTREKHANGVHETSLEIVVDSIYIKLRFKHPCLVTHFTYLSVYNCSLIVISESEEGALSHSAFKKIIILGSDTEVRTQYLKKTNDR